MVPFEGEQSLSDTVNFMQFTVGVHAYLAKAPIHKNPGEKSLVWLGGVYLKNKKWPVLMENEVKYHYE